MSEQIGDDGKVTWLFSNGKKEVLFKKGVWKEIFPDGYHIVFFKNEDIKQTYPDGTIVYFFAET